AVRCFFFQAGHGIRDLIVTGVQTCALPISKSFPGYGPYVASKAGAEELVRVLANGLRGRGITVNAVAPGPVATGLFFNGKTEQQIGRASCREGALGKFGVHWLSVTQHGADG